MKNNKRIASSSPLSGSWIMIAALFLRVEDVKTWTTLPTSISCSLRQLPPRTNGDVFLRYIENPFRKQIPSASLPMAIDADGDGQQQEEYSENTDEDDQTDEDSIMEIANALTSSKPPSLDKSDDLVVETNEVDNYLDKAAVAWEGSAVSAKVNGFENAKINKTKLVGLAARESFLSGGFKTIKGSIPKSNTRAVNDVEAAFEAPAAKGVPFPSISTESQPVKPEVGPMIKSFGSKLKADISTPLKGGLPKQFASSVNQSYGNTFLSSLKVQKGAAGLGEVKQFTNSFFKSMKSPGYGEEQKPGPSNSSSGPKIGLGVLSGPKSSLKGPMSITKQSTDNVSSSSRPKKSQKEAASNESSPLRRELDGEPFLSSLKITKGTIESAVKKQVVGSLLKSIKSPGIVGKQKSVDGVNESSESESKVGVEYPSGLRTLKTSNPMIKRSIDLAKDADKESTLALKSFMKPNDIDRPTRETDVSDGDSIASTSQSSGSNGTSIASAVNSSVGEYSRKAAIDFHEESKELEEREKWISEQNQLVEERRRTRLEESNLGDDGTKVAIDFGEESEALDEWEKWISEQNRLIEERRLKRLQDPNVGAVGSEVVVDFDEESAALKEKERIVEQNIMIDGRAKREKLGVDSQVDSDNIPLKGDDSLQIRNQSDGNSFLSSLKVPKGAGSTGEKQQAKGAFLKSIKAPGLGGVQGAVNGAIGSFSKIDISTSGLNIAINQSMSSEKSSDVTKDKSKNLSDSVDIPDFEKSYLSNSGEEKLVSSPFFVNDLSMNDSVSVDDGENVDDAEDQSSDTVGEASTSVGVGNAVAGDPIDFKKEARSLEEQEQWIKEQNQLVEERRLKRLQESGTSNADNGVEQATYPPKPHVDGVMSFTDNVSIADSSQLVIDSSDENKKLNETDPVISITDHDDEVSLVNTIEGVANAVSVVNTTIQALPPDHKGELKLLGNDLSKSKPGFVSSGLFKGFPAKTSGLPFPPTAKKPVKTLDPGNTSRAVAKGVASKEYGPQKDRSPSPALAVGMAPPTLTVDLPTKKSFVNGANPASIKSFAFGPPKSKLDVVSSVPVKGFEAKKTGLSFPPIVKGSLETIGANVLRGAKSGDSSPEDNGSTSQAKVVGIVPPVVLKGVATAESSVKGANPAFSSGIKGTLKSFGIDPSKSKLGFASSLPLKGFAAKTAGLPFPPPVKGSRKTLGANVLQDAYDSSPEEDGSTSSAKVVGIAPPVVLKGVATAESSVKGASTAFSSGLKGTIKSFGIESSKSKLGVASSVPIQAIASKAAGLPFPPTTKDSLETPGAGVASPKLRDAKSGDSSPEDNGSTSPAKVVGIVPPVVLKGVATAESSVKVASPVFSPGLKGTFKSFGTDPSKSNLGVASSVPIQAFASKTAGSPSPSARKGSVKTLGAGIAPPALRGAESDDSNPEEDGSTIPAKVGIVPSVGLKGVATTGSSVKGASPPFSSALKGTFKSFGVDSFKSKLGAASFLPKEGFASKTIGLPFPPPVKGSPETSGTGIAPPALRDAKSGDSSPEDNESTSPAKLVGIVPPIVLKGVATAESSVKGASPAFPSGLNGAIKSFGVDSSKSKLGAVSSFPVQAFASKTAGLPFPPPVKGSVKTLGAGIAPPALQDPTKHDSRPREDGSFDYVKTDFNDPDSKVSKSVDDNVATSPTASEFQYVTSEDNKTHMINAPDDRVRKEIGTGAPFEPKAFSPPRTRSDRRNPGIIDVAFESSADDDGCGPSELDKTGLGNETKEKKKRQSIQSSRPFNLWSGESFKGTVSSRSYGLGFNRPLASPDSSDSKLSGVEPNQKLLHQERDADENTFALNTDNTAVASSKSLNLLDKNMTTGDTHTAPEMDLKIKLLEEKNRLLEEKLKLKIFETSKIEEDKRKAEQRLYSEQIGVLSNHISRLEKQVCSAADKAETAVRSREDEIKRMAEIIERKTNRQAFLEQTTETLLREIEDIRLSTEERNRIDMENLKNAFLESVKIELSDLKTIHKQELHSIAAQLKVEQEKRKKMSKINQSQSKLLSDLKTRLIDSKEHESLSKTNQIERENETALKDINDQTQLNVEEVMENIQNIAPLHNIILASDDVSDKHGSTKTDKSVNNLPKYETLSQGALIPTAPPPRRSGFDDQSSHTTEEVPSTSSGVEISEAAGDTHAVHHNIPDALAADVEALELISFCHADFDSETPSVVHPDYDPIRKLQECAIPSNYPFVSILRDSSPYIVNHRHSTIVYHIPGELISDSQKFFSVMDDIALTWLFGMKIVIAVGCRRQIVQRLEKLHGATGAVKMPGVRVTTPETLRILEEEAGFCRFEVERLLNRCLRNKGADCNVVSGCFITANKFGVVDGIDYQLTGYPVNLQVDKIHRLHSRNDVILLTPLGFTKEGDALNVHSEALAAFTAGELKASKVVYFSSHPMVLRGTRNRNSGKERIQMIQRSNANEILSYYGLHVNSVTGFPSWKSHFDIKGNLINRALNLSYHQQSMLLKMGWATHAIEKGVERAHIIDCEDGSLLDELFTARRGYGTCISQDNYEAPHPEDWNDDLTVADGVDKSMIEW